MRQNLFSVENKIVVITGGLGQLGRQFAFSLLDQGAKVAIFDIDINKEKVAKRFGGQTTERNLLFLSVNITKRESIEGGLKQVNEAWGTPDGLINNAAMDSPPDASAEENGPFESYPAESLDKISEVNIKGCFQCCQVIGGQMAKAGGGSIVNICSIYGVVSPDQRIYEYRKKDGTSFFKPAAYSVSKSALLNLTRYLATYWGDKNVRVNTLTPGGVFNDQDEQFLDGYCRRVPLGRMAREDEYNGAILFLMSKASAYMTGANLVIDGGWTAW